MQLSAPVTACRRVVAPSPGKVSELASVSPLHIDGEAGPREERDCQERAGRASSPVSALSSSLRFLGKGII